MSCSARSWPTRRSEAGLDPEHQEYEQLLLGADRISGAVIGKPGYIRKHQEHKLQLLGAGHRVGAPVVKLGDVRKHHCLNGFIGSLRYAKRMRSLLMSDGRYKFSTANSAALQIASGAVSQSSTVHLPHSEAYFPLPSV